MKWKEIERFIETLSILPYEGKGYAHLPARPEVQSGAEG
jgi:hypothetical protein